MPNPPTTNPATQIAALGKFGPWMLPVIYLMSGGTLGGMVMAEKDCESYPNLEYKIERLTDELADALAVNGALLGQFTHLSTQLAVCSTDDE